MHISRNANHLKECDSVITAGLCLTPRSFSGKRKTNTPQGTLQVDFLRGCPALATPVDSADGKCWNTWMLLQRRQACGTVLWCNYPSTYSPSSLQRRREECGLKAKHLISGKQSVWITGYRLQSWGSSRSMKEFMDSPQKCVMTEEETLRSTGCIHCVVTSKDQKSISEGGLGRKTEIHVRRKRCKKQPCPEEREELGLWRKHHRRVPSFPVCK